MQKDNKDHLLGEISRRQVSRLAGRTASKCCRPTMAPQTGHSQPVRRALGQTGRQTDGWPRRPEESDWWLEEATCPSGVRPATDRSSTLSRHCRHDPWFMRTPNQAPSETRPSPLPHPGPVRPLPTPPRSGPPHPAGLEYQSQSRRTYLMTPECQTERRLHETPRPLPLRNTVGQWLRPPGDAATYLTGQTQLGHGGSPDFG